MPSVTPPARHAAVLGQSAFGRWLLLVAAAAIAFLTLTPSGDNGTAALTPFWCLRCGDFGAVDVVLNTLLFIPLGLALGLMGLPWRRIVLTALLTTVGIEALQLAVIPGRDASISDMLTNTTGGTTGAALALHWRRLVFPRAADARALLAMLALTWTAARLGTAWLLRPSLPDTVWYGQIAPTDVYPADFRGEVLHADIGGVPARSGRMPELHAALRAPAVGARALVSGAGRTPRLASVISVLDVHRAEVLVLGQEGSAARFRFRLRTADARFRTPSVRLDGALPLDSRGPTELIGFRSPGRLSLSSSTLGRHTEATIALGPGLGWALLLPFDTGLTPTLAYTGTAALAAAVLLLVGYFAGMSVPGRPVAATSVAVAVASVGLWGPSIGFPEATVAASEVFAAAPSAIVGILVATGVGWTAKRRDQLPTRTDAPVR